MVGRRQVLPPTTALPFEPHQECPRSDRRRPAIASSGRDRRNRQRPAA